jgi:paraquat-inducible protein B
MPDNDKSFPQVPEAKAVPKRRTRLSLVWVIPIVAAAAGVWIAVTKILNEGPTITIVFSSADGLEANKTKVNYNGLDVGTLTSIRLADDHQHVIATAAMSPKAKDFLVKDTQFWVVKPRMSGLNVSGLGTLISGYYIGVQLGQSKESERRFIALEAPPFAGNVSGRFFHAQDHAAGFARRRHADFFPAVVGRPGGVLRTGQGRRIPEREGIRAGALRPICQPGHAVLAGERD